MRLSPLRRRIHMLFSKVTYVSGRVFLMLISVCVPLSAVLLKGGNGCFVQIVHICSDAAKTWVLVNLKVRGIRDR